MSYKQVVIWKSKRKLFFITSIKYCDLKYCCLISNGTRKWPFSSFWPIISSKQELLVNFYSDFWIQQVEIHKNQLFLSPKHFHYWPVNLVCIIFYVILLRYLFILCYILGLFNFSSNIYQIPNKTVKKKFYKKSYFYFPTIYANS